MAERIAYSGFVGGTYLASTRRAGDELALNIYPIIHHAPGVRPPHPMTFHHTPGTRTFASVGPGPVVDMLLHGGVYYVLSGSGLYTMTAAGTVTLLGAVTSSVLPAKLETNGVQIMAISGGLGYIYTIASGAFAQITDPNFPANVVSLAFSDSYFLVSSYGSREFQYSGRFNGLTWSATDKGVLQQATNPIRRLLVVNKDVWIMTETRTEVWGNTGSAVATFAPIQGVLLESGIGPVESATNVDQFIAWIQSTKNGGSVAVYAEGYQITRFSTPGVEAAWSRINTDKAFAWTYMMDGHLVWVVTFPEADVTWAFDFTTRCWFQLGLLDTMTGEQTAHIGRCHVHAKTFSTDVHFVGSRLSGTVYVFDPSHYYDVDTTPRVKMRRAPHVSAKPGLINVQAFDMDADSGVALASGQGSEPLIAFRYSTDGGMTYSDRLWLQSGALGEWDSRVGIERLGDGQEWVFEVSTSEPLPVHWGGAQLAMDLVVR